MIKNKFEFFGKTLSPEKEKEYRVTITESIQKRRDALEKLSIEPEQKLGEWEGRLQEKYKKEYLALGGETLPDVKVYFIPSSKSIETLKILGEKNTDPDFYYGGIGDAFSQSFVIFIEDGNLSNLHSARTLAHELSHAYGYAFSRYVIKDEDSNPTQIVAASSGISFSTRTGDFGRFLEEWYAVERELEALPELKNLFPEESKKAEIGLASMVTGGLISKEAALYTSVYDNTKKDKTRSLTTYFMAHPLGSEIMARIPDGRNILAKARVSGKLAQLSKAINDNLGEGAFKLIMSVNPKDKNSCDHLKQFLSKE